MVQMMRPLPNPPSFAGLCLSFGRVVVIEWLFDDDKKKTGTELVQWMREKRYNQTRSVELRVVRSASEFIAVLHKVADETEARGRWPLIHVEAHGEDAELPNGYVGPDGTGGMELLAWDDLVQPLARINIGTQCNLMFVSSACWGHAAILATCQTDRLPFVACVGFATEVNEGSVLRATKEFYRQLFSEPKKQLAEIIDAAERELDEGEILEFDSMVRLSYDTITENIRETLNPDALRNRALNNAMRLINGGIANIGALPFDTALSQLHQEQGAILQMIWNRRFMIDLFPSNRERFGVDVAPIIASLLDQEHAVAPGAVG